MFLDTLQRRLLMITSTCCSASRLRCPSLHLGAGGGQLGGDGGRVVLLQLRRLLQLRDLNEEEQQGISHVCPGTQSHGSGRSASGGDALAHKQRTKAAEQNSNGNAQM